MVPFLCMMDYEDLANLFKTLGSNPHPPILARECIVHFAMRHGQSDPLELREDGRFEEWQSFQEKRNFGRRFVVALIHGEGDCWRFAGVYEVMGEPKDAVESHRSRARELKIPDDWVDEKLKWVYDMRPVTVPDELEDTTVCIPKNRAWPKRYPFADELLKRLGR